MRQKNVTYNQTIYDKLATDKSGDLKPTTTKISLHSYKDLIDRLQEAVPGDQFQLQTGTGFCFANFSHGFRH